MDSLKAPQVGRTRGMRDLLPDDMRAFRRVEDAFRESALRWGYDEIRTPTLEPYRLFTTAGALTPDMLSRVYSFLDWDGWSGERVVLRPDSTIPVVRAATAAKLPLPARLFYVQNRFRFTLEDDEREDWQCGVEFLGAPQTTGDLEVATMACETLETLGLEPAVRLAHVGLTLAVLAAAGGGSEGLVQTSGLRVLAQSAPTDSPMRPFLEVALQRSAGVSLLLNLEGLARTCLPSAVPALRELQAIAAALEESGRDVVVDLGMPRDFEYYTGIVFEFESDGNAWGGGGRYAPAGSGFAGSACGLGLEVARLAGWLASSTHRRSVVSVIPAGADEYGRAIAVARALHRSGIDATLEGANGASNLTVRVGKGGLTAHTPAGSRSLAALEDLVELLIQFK